MNPIIKEMYDISRDKDKILPDKFKKYVADKKYVVAKRSILVYGWAYEFEHADSLTSAEYRLFVDEVIGHMETNFNGYFDCLIQFWRAEERVVNNSVGERRFLLTLRNQPFLLEGRYSEGTHDDKICRYRTNMHDVIVDGDGTGGPIGRVFRNNRMESSPNVSYYSDNEYPQPQRNIAISCGVSSYLVLPWLDSSGHVVGAIEFVSLLELPLFYRLPSNPLCSNSSYSDNCIRLCGKYDSEKDSLISAVTEIHEVIGEVCERRDVVRCAKTWMLCKHCNSLSSVKRCAGELKSLSKYFINKEGSIFLVYLRYYNLKKGEGVVGKAAESSHDLVYCEDVAKFSITKYPLAHFARYYGLSASFAIRLKSNQTGDQVYVLEFFLHPDYVRGKNLRATLVPILETMSQRFKTIKFASGGELRDSLFPQVIDANFPDKFETFKVGGLDSTDDHITEMDFYTSPRGGESMGESNDPMIWVETSCQDVSATTFRIERPVTIKANYKGSFLKFKLPPSSGIDELNHQVSHRLELAIGTYYLEYRDDMGDHILLACDEDLQMYISSSTKEENYTLLVFVFPK